MFTRTGTYSDTPIACRRKLEKTTHKLMMTRPMGVRTFETRPFYGCEDLVMTCPVMLIKAVALS